MVTHGERGLFWTDAAAMRRQITEYELPGDPASRQLDCVDLLLLTQPPSRAPERGR